ncbi:MAG: arginase [Chloroflexaceae bacterium]|nr:arginase [Chloroflexaceae bacterium]
MVQPREIAIVGVPLDLGAGRRGVDMGPSAIRYAGLQRDLRGLGHHVTDYGNLAVPLAETVPMLAGQDVAGRAGVLHHLAPIAAVCAEVAETVAAHLAAGAVPLVLGGDHSVALGAVAGAAQGRTLGLLWIDAHPDFNTAETSPSGNIHGMPLAALTGRGHPHLTSVNGFAQRVPIIQPAHIALIGIRDVDPLEREALHEAGIHAFTMHDIDRQGIATIIEQAMRIVSRGTDAVHVSFDLDVVDPHEAPGVGTPVPGGISYREAHLAMEMIAQSAKLVSLDVVEVNPILDERNITAQLAAALVLSALGKRIL